MRGLSYSRSVMAVHVPGAHGADADMHSQAAPDDHGKASSLQQSLNQPQVALCANSRYDA